MKRNKSYPKGYLLCFFTLALILCSTSAFGAIIRVPGDQPTIQAGIDAASPGDTVLVADGTYTGTGNKWLNFNGKAITVQSETGPDNTIIDCEGVGNGFNFYSGEGQDSVLSGFTIKNSQANGHAIHIDNSSPTITDCTITGNGGGGIYCGPNSSPTIRNCLITANSGSGIFPGDNSSPTITNCTITGNTAEIGGGIHVYNASPTITNCTIKENNTTGGATIHVDENSSLTITDCTIADNTAGFSGGIGVFGSSLTITNSIISNNTGENGGGIGVFDSSVNVINCTIADNTALYLGGGIVCDPNSSLIITNSILWGDSPDEINAVPSTTTVTFSDIQGGYAGEGNINVDPLFVGGGDYHLTAGSPCIDVGTDAGVYTDIDGDPRPLGAGFDMGSDEYAAPPSCPELYSWNGEEWENNGSIFTKSHCPESESFQQLLVTRPVTPQGGDTLPFKIKELDGEISYINNVAMYYKYEGDSANAWTELDLGSAIHNTADDVSKALEGKDDQRVNTVPGDEILLTYGLPSRGLEGAIFKSVSSGYYLWSNVTYCQVLELGPELEVQPGDTVTLKARINNMSTYELTENAIVWFSIRGANWPPRKVASVSATGLAPASPQWYSCEWPVPNDAPAGTYTYDASIWIGSSNITWRGGYQSCRVNVSSQPSGGSESGGSGTCFIATAAFESYMEPSVLSLRAFRDTYLLPCRLGRMFVNTYSRYSPAIADFIAKHDSLKTMVRVGLLPLMAVSYSTLHLGLKISTTMLIFVLVFPIFLVLYYRRSCKTK
jgi:parallel beta-helix repeat protein